jgi:hypothetical protein
MNNEYLVSYDNLGNPIPLTSEQIISDAYDEANIIDKEAPPIEESLLKLETIFDHNPTEDELEQLTGRVIDKEYYEKRFNKDLLFFHIYSLYLIRGDKETADKYYLMISEEVRKNREEVIKNRVIA